MESIVSYIDMIGVGELLGSARSQEAIELMCSMHKLAYSAGSNQMPAHDHIYFWNDSILAYGQAGSRAACEAVMKEVNGLKRTVDRICPCYAISIVGDTFPEPFAHLGYHFGHDFSQSKTVFLRPSGIAFANCFTVEKVLGRKHKKPWYLDQTIAAQLDVDRAFTTDQVTVYPGGTTMTVRIYDGDLWEQDLEHAI